MKPKSICTFTILLMIVCQPLLAHPTRSPLPDLRIRSFLSPPTAPQKLKVLVVNIGHVHSAPCVLRLTVIRIKGASVSRTTDVQVPGMAAGRLEWLLIDASSILPKGIALSDTAFNIDVDPDDLVDEVNEKNNHLSYKPQVHAR